MSRGEHSTPPPPPPRASVSMGCRLCELLSDQSQHGNHHNNEHVTMMPANHMLVPQLREMLLAAYLLRGNSCSWMWLGFLFNDVFFCFFSVRDICLGCNLVSRKNILFRSFKPTSLQRNVVITIITLFLNAEINFFFHWDEFKRCTNCCHIRLGTQPS